MTTAERIRNRRINLGMTGDDLARRIGVSKTTVYRYENGGIEKIPMNHLQPIAQALNVSVAYLMGWEDDCNSQAAKAEADWLSKFRDHLGFLLSTSDPTDLYDAGINRARLETICEGGIPVSLSEACDISDQFGCSLDEMVGLDKKTPTSADGDGRDEEFVQLYRQLTDSEKAMLLAQIKGLLAGR